MFQTVLAEIIKSGILSRGNKNCIGENGNYIEYVLCSTFMNKTCIPILILPEFFEIFIRVLFFSFFFPLYFRAREFVLCTMKRLLNCCEL